MSIESQNIQTNKKDTLANMIDHKFWIKRNKFRTTHKERLAKMAWVSTEEYIWARKNNNKKNIEYNNIIRNKILKGEIFPLHNYADRISKFSSQHQKAIQNAFPEDQINNYISNLTDQQIQKFATLDPIQLISLLQQEIHAVAEKKRKIQNDYWDVLKKETYEQILNLNQLIDIEKRIDAFVEANNIPRLVIDRSTWIFKDKNTEEKFKIFSQKKRQEHTEDYAKMVHIRGEEGAEQHLRYIYIAEVIETPEIQATLSDEAKSQFVTIVRDLYTTSQKLGIDVVSFGLQEIYITTQNYLTAKYTDTSIYSTLIQNIHTDPDIGMYFQEHTPTQLLLDTQKNKSYYTKLGKRYPELIKQDEWSMLEFFDEHMQIKNTSTPEEKTRAHQRLDTVNKQSEPYEKKLLNMTNTLTQEIAIEQCMTTLQSYMDISIDQKESMLQQLKIDSTTDAVQNMVLRIDGKLNGKPVKISYDLLSGKVYYASFLNKKSYTDQSPLFIWTTSAQTGIPLVTLPKLSDFIDTEQKLDYVSLIDEAETVGDYQKKFATQIKTESNRANQWDTDIQQDMLKKMILKDTITQNIFSLTGRKEYPQDQETILAPNTQPHMYALYESMYKSLSYYSMQGLSQMQLFQENIVNMLQYRQDKWKDQAVENLQTRKGENQEMFVLQALTNRAIIPDLTTVASNQEPEQNLMMFFKCFERQTGGIAIIDVEMMADYLKAATGTNKEKVGKREKNQAFTTISQKLEEKLEGNNADDILANWDMENLPEIQKSV